MFGLSALENKWVTKMLPSLAVYVIFFADCFVFVVMNAKQIKCEISDSGVFCVVSVTQHVFT